MPEPSSSPTEPRFRPPRGLVTAALVVLVVATFWPVVHNGFVLFDDGEYIAQNPWVAGGLRWSGVAWAFRSFHSSNWHPLTWLSHMLDVELFGMSAGWHHGTSLVLHAAATALLFVWLREATGSTWRSALAAALFGVHPLHVESVAWAAERKDVLCALFWVVSLLAYTRWTRQPTALRYGAVLAAVAAALMSKPMAVSLPFALLLVDAWPLGRVRLGAPWSRFLPLLREKVPLFILGAGSCWVTVAAQARAQAMRSLGAVDWTTRLSNAAVSYVRYLQKTLWPVDLAVFYPHPAATGGLAPWTVAGSGLLLAAVTGAALALRRSRPALAVGWAWYLVTLVPVIGLVQVGSQAMADRYTYLPLVGVFIALAWALPPPPNRPALIATAASACACLVLALAVVARAQVGVWRTTFTLFRHAADVTEGNWLALKNVGVEYLRLGDVPAAARSLQASVQAWPHDPAAWMDLAAARSALGDHAAAAAALRRVVALRAGDAEAWYLLGLEGHLTGDASIAREALDRLDRIRPEAAGQLRDALEGRLAR